MATSKDELPAYLREIESEREDPAPDEQTLAKVARMIADLNGFDDIQAAYVAEAIPYRSLDRKFRGCRLEQRMFEEDQDLLSTFVETGLNLSLEEADALERDLLTTPDDLDLRIRLLGFYILGHHKSPEAVEARTRHVLWMIEHAPDCPFAGSPHATIRAHSDPSNYRTGKDLWLEQITRQPDNPKILWNAAHFVQNQDRQLSYDLLTRGRSLEPDNLHWCSALALWLMIDLISCPPEKRCEQAQTALALYEQALQAEMHPCQRHFLLNYAARAAYEAGDYAGARLYADQLLEEATPTEEDADRLHQGNIMLGRLALQENDVEAAKACLLQAAQVLESPVLGSFGPNMILAQQLLERGEREIVLEYFDRCALFWKRDELNVWRAEIQRGAMPNFGGNLVY